MAQMIEYRAEPEWLGMVTYPSDTPLTAAGIPVKPPKQWFDDPKFSRLTPLTVTSDGQVYGHVASWESSHIGRLGKVRPPRSKSQYQYFRTGEVETDDGSMISVGQITLTGGHAPLEATAAAAVAHYDNTSSAIMDVAAGEDRHGIWVAGALRPDVDDIKIRAIRASSYSGDWRPIDHALELVAICAVNVPGFPIPRALAMAASASDDSEGELTAPEIYALVAAGTEALVAMAHRDPLVAAAAYVMEDLESKMDWLREALSVLEPPEDLLEQVGEATGEVTEGIEAAADGTETELVVEGGEEQPETDTVEIIPDPEVPEEDLGDPDDDGESESTMAEAPEPVFAFSDSIDGLALAREISEGAAAEILWDDNLPLHFTTAQAEAVALRLRFRGAAVTVDPAARSASAEAGIAMPDGRFPIQSTEDVVAALQIVPEGTAYWDHVSARAAELGIEDLDTVQEEVLTAAATKGKYDFGTRLKMVKSGEAMKGGAYPIKDEEDLKNAIQSIGRAKDPAAARAHVMKRARALRLVNLLPEKWSD